MMTKNLSWYLVFKLGFLPLADPMKITFILLMFLLLHQPMINNQILVCSCCCNSKREEARLSILFSNYNKNKKLCLPFGVWYLVTGWYSERNIFLWSNMTWVIEISAIQYKWISCRYLREIWGIGLIIFTTNEGLKNQNHGSLFFICLPKSISILIKIFRLDLSWLC